MSGQNAGAWNLTSLSVKSCILGGTIWGTGTLWTEKHSTTEEEKDVGVKVTKNLKWAAQCAAAGKTAQTVIILFPCLPVPLI